MLAFTVRRLFIAIPILLASSIVTFILVANSGDPLEDLRTRRPPVPQSTIDAKRHELRLDQSFVERYWSWLSGLFHGDFGPSTQSLNIGHELGHRLIVTMRMVAFAMLIAVVLAVIVGVISAVRQYSGMDYAFTFSGFLFLSMPSFWLAILLKEFVAIKLNDATGKTILYTIGDSSVEPKHGFFAVAADLAGHMFLPTLVLALISYASWSRFQRASMLDVLNSDYIRLARAKGLSNRRVMVRHALRTALIPLTTVTALDLAGILGGAVITERVFQWHGMGELLINGISHRDVYVVLAWLMATGFIVVLFNLIADLLYAVLDPRIRYA